MIGTHGIYPGSEVKHFKRDMLPPHDEQLSGPLYCYKVLAFATHTETKEKLVVYRAMYTSHDMGVTAGQVFCRPYDMFMSEVDHVKYPDAKQKYRFEVIQYDDDGNTVNL